MSADEVLQYFFRNIFSISAFRITRYMRKRIKIKVGPTCTSFKEILVEDFAKPSKIIRTLVVVFVRLYIAYCDKEKLRVILSWRFEVILVMWPNAVYSRINVTYCLYNTFVPNCEVAFPCRESSSSCTPSEGNIYNIAPIRIPYLYRPQKVIFAWMRRYFLIWYIF